LTMTGAVKLLEELREPDKPRSRNTRQRGKRGDAIAAAIKKDPLAIVERAWPELSDGERDIFLTKVSA